MILGLVKALALYSPIYMTFICVEIHLHMFLLTHFIANKKVVLKGYGSTYHHIYNVYATADWILIFAVSSVVHFRYLQHCAGINCLSLLNSLGQDECDYLFTGSRDGTLKRWALAEDAAAWSATFESHVDWVHSFCSLLFSFFISLYFLWRLMFSAGFSDKLWSSFLSPYLSTVLLVLIDHRFQPKI